MVARSPVRRATISLSDANSVLTNARLLRLLLQSRRFATELRKQCGGGDGCQMNEAIRRKRRSDTVFILGSGGTVNDYSAERWSHIAEHNTIGITNWVLHSFVPDVFIFESDRIAENNDIFFENLTARWKDYERSVLCWKDPGRALTMRTGARTPAGANNLFVPLMVELPENYRFILRNYSRTVGAIRRLLGALRVCFVMQKRATVSYAVDLAVQAGFKAIVLCGVDLRSTKYFWEAEARPDRIAPSVTLPPTQQEGRALHSTMDPAVNVVTIDQVIYDVDTYYVRRFGARLFVAADSSALHPKIDVYPWTQRMDCGRSPGPSSTALLK